MFVQETLHKPNVRHDICSYTLCACSAWLHAFAQSGCSRLCVAMAMAIPGSALVAYLKFAAGVVKVAWSVSAKPWWGVGHGREWSGMAFPRWNCGTGNSSVAGIPNMPTLSTLHELKWSPETSWNPWKQLVGSNLESSWATSQKSWPWEGMICAECPTGAGCSRLDVNSNYKASSGKLVYQGVFQCPTCCTWS